MVISCSSSISAISFQAVTILVWGRVSRRSRSLPRFPRRVRSCGRLVGVVMVGSPRRRCRGPSPEERERPERGRSKVRAPARRRTHVRRLGGKARAGPSLTVGWTVSETDDEESPPWPPGRLSTETSSPRTVTAQKTRRVATRRNAPQRGELEVTVPCRDAFLLRAVRTAGKPAGLLSLFAGDLDRDDVAGRYKPGRGVAPDFAGPKPSRHGQWTVQGCKGSRRPQGVVLPVGGWRTRTTVTAQQTIAAEK